MRLIFAALVAIALVCPRPAIAQQQVVPYAGSALLTVTGTLTTITTDTVPIVVSGAMWATARFTVVSAGTATATAQYTKDGTNWLAAPYAVKVASSANPTTQAISSTTLTTGDIWEVPLPGSAIGFQILCGASGTATTVRVYPGAPYVPGIPVTATISDVTEGSIGAGLSTSTTPIDISGWNSVTITGVSPTTQVVTVRQLDDAGALIAGAAFTMTATSTGTLTLTRGGGQLAAQTVSAGGYVAVGLIAKRISAYIPSGGTVTTGRIRTEASR